MRLAHCLKRNSGLATKYHCLQCEFIEVKTEALKVIEKKLKLETSLRDHQQVSVALYNASYMHNCSC